MNRFSFWIVLIFTSCAFAQETSINYRTKTVAVTDSIRVEPVSINPNRFEVLLKDGTPLDSSLYSINFPKALLVFKKPIAADSIVINYLKYPDFLTKTYKLFDKSVIVENNANEKRLQKLTEPNSSSTYKPFDGLNTSGSISRGVTVGNNQNSVLNSALDLQVSGKLSDKITLRASIQDANIPLQESGYSQRLDKFDQVFIELFTDDWNVRAGDIDLENNTSYFSQFSKRVQGLSINANVSNTNSKTRYFGSGALVRGQFTTSQFTAQEGNQGPYKLQGTNGELFVKIISGSETVYVNGIALKRGENEDYIINYNAGEIIFNPTFPITSEMRITVDYQFSDRNYSRLVAYGGTQVNAKKFNLGVSVYSENDSKNNPLQQNLSTEQALILANAGDNPKLMVAPSATQEPYNENRILYKKETINGVEAFVFSTNPEDTLYSVKFSRVPEKTGNYILINKNAINAVYEYIAPISGVSQGNYDPVFKLEAPTKLQVAVFNGEFKPSQSTTIDFELAASKNDSNLFSKLDDEDNDGFATHFNINQQLFKKDSTWTINAFGTVDYIQQEFRNIEGLYKPEFNRDWNLAAQPSSNLITNLSDQFLYSSGLNYTHSKLGRVAYTIEHLNLSEVVTGSKHQTAFNITLGNLKLTSNSSFLTTDANTSTSTFNRTHNTLKYYFKQFWLGSGFSAEDNQQKDKSTQLLSNLSQRFKAYNVFTGIGDTAKVFSEIGYKYRVNDSIKNNTLQKVNTSNTYYLDSRFIKTKNTNLSLYSNYRVLNFEDTAKDETSLNSRLQYNQLLFKRFIQSNTLLETNSGTLPRQDFSYVEVDPGRGAYMWIDYNNNGIQELNEFELAQFKDQGKYVRLLLPNQIFIKTHDYKVSQTLTINPHAWSKSEQGFKKVLAHFYNQSSFLTQRKNERQSGTFNPFKFSSDIPLGVQLNFRNVLFFNRGKQRYTTSYTYLKNNTRNVLSIGYIDNFTESHQLNFNHTIKKTWLTQLLGVIENSKSDNENFIAKNFKIDTYSVNPKLSYLANNNTRFDVFYQFSKKDNYLTGIEQLQQDKYGVSFSFSPKDASQRSVTGEFNFFQNTFNGNPNSPVGFQLLEGLQPGKNFTWSLLAQQKITKYLDLNLNYFARKTETSKTIHTGSVELKAYF